MYFDRNNSVGDLVIIEGGQVGKIKSVDVSTGTAVVEVLSKGWGPYLEDKRVGYYNKAVCSPVCQYWRSNRHAYDLVKYNGVYYDHDILFFQHGVLMNPKTGTLMDWDVVRDNKDYYCDGISILHRSDIRVCEHCGNPILDAGFDIYFVENDSLVKKNVCAVCFKYDFEITRRNLDICLFDEPIKYMEDAANEHFSKTDDAMIISNDCRLTWMWDGDNQFIFDVENHSDDIRRCKGCRSWFKLSKKQATACDPFIERFFGKLRSNDDYCGNCDSNKGSRKVESYYYKPDPIMIGEGRHYGVELELDDGIVGPACACVFELEYNGVKPYYAKHDGSLGNNGMEIVSHPMTIECHKEAIGQLLEITNHFGFENSHRCGLHVHTSRSDWGNDVSDKVYTLLYRFKDAVFEMSEREAHEDMDDWAGVNDVYFEKNGDCYSVVADGSEDRYHALNTKNSNTYEIRIFASTTCEERYVDCIKWVDSLFDYADSHTLLECANAHYVDVFGVDLGCDENEIHIEDVSKTFNIWCFSNGEYLYVKRTDRYKGTFKHYHVVGYDHSCTVKLPLSGRKVGYAYSHQYIGISDSNISNCFNQISEVEMELHNNKVLELLNKEEE